MMSASARQPGSHESHSQSTVDKIVVVTADPIFADCARTAFGTGTRMALEVIKRTLSAAEAGELVGAAVLVADLDGGDENEITALERIMALNGHRVPVIVVAKAFDELVARRLMQMRVADFLRKPVSEAELLRTCARITQPLSGSEASQAQIFTFLPAVGGAGVTTLAVQAAMLLLNNTPRGKAATCLVDLDFQHGACADYLDIEPQLDLGEIELRPERLDRQLLEVMLSYHASGLAVVAAPNRPAEMRSFEPSVVTRLLDLVSSHFDFVVFDMPRTWFSWTDDVLLGSDMVYIVSETTVPSLRQARQLVDAIRERLGEQPNPQVIVNRFEQKFFSPGLRRADIERAIGASLAAFIPNNYGLVREAIDRGVPLNEVKPGNKITAQLKKLIISHAAQTAKDGLPAPLKASGSNSHQAKSWKRTAAL